MKTETYEIVILGTGPAGLQAAIHASRSKTDVLVMGREHKSSLYKAHVENYCCLSGIAGEELLTEGIRQAESGGADFLHEDVLKIEQGSHGFNVQTENRKSINTRGLILAMGISRHKLGAAGEKEFLGKGVSYCVDCDAGFYRGEKVAIVGNESAAVAGALTMLFYASEVHLIAEKIQVSEQLDFQIRESAVHIHEDRRIREITGDHHVERVVLDNNDSIEVTGVFIELGAKGAVELATTLGVALDPEQMKYIVTDKLQKTNVQGIFAAGDICGPPWQMAKAVGEGCVAGLTAAKYIKKLR